jgi:hypothetical protein
MKFNKFLFALLFASALVFSCKSEKKEATEAAEDAIEAIEEAGQEAGEAMEEGAEAVGEAAESAAEAVAEEVEGATKGIEEMAVAEGVMTEDLADTPVIYPGCEGGENAAAIRACSKDKFIAYLKNEFNRDLAKEAGLDPGDHRINTVVQVDEAGKVTALKVTSSNYQLESEMKRVIGALPQMTPATKGGEAVPVTFILPLDFKVE